MSLSTQELQLCRHLVELPKQHGYRYSESSSRDLLYNLFWSLAGGKPDYMRMFFPDGKLSINGCLDLRVAQGAMEGAEYTEAARGKPCGHIFRAGEATYSCRTCSADDTVVLCSKCFDATNHSGHMVKLTISPGNSGCCDCGDEEAWKLPLHCTIHSERLSDKAKGKNRAAAAVPDDLAQSLRMTIARVIDFICDVVSCAPEQLRQAKSQQSIEQDEKLARLTSAYGGFDENSGEYAVLLWNDEKHTVDEVQQQVARACRTTARDGHEKALETDNIGRSILTYDRDITNLLRVAKLLEQIKVTVTIRSARDTFREQMCGTMIGWLNDISGCSVGSDASILRMTICEELLGTWRVGSSAVRAKAGTDGLVDEAHLEDQHDEERLVSGVHLVGNRGFFRRNRLPAGAAAAPDAANDGTEDSDGDFTNGDDTLSSEEETDDTHNDEDDDEANDDDEPLDDEEDDGDVMMVDAATATRTQDSEMEWERENTGEALEDEEASLAGYPPPPPPPPAPPHRPVRRRTARDRDVTPSDSDTAEPLIAPSLYAKAHMEVPKTPGASRSDGKAAKPGRYWLETPEAYLQRQREHPYEDVFTRVRLDWLILFDLRLWKKVRNDLRSLYISTVVSIPAFKRVLGLRFAAFYTTLAQLYLIGDREPDHSIVNISLQMLTTPSITAEVVERGNFLTTLMAILYTFLTTRQVGRPWEVSSTAVLGFDSGSVTNRRVHHFYHDMKYMFGSPHVQERMRTQERYLLQFLDLVKLHQGICPNTRAMGEHVEYETDTWIGASLMTREMNRLCRMLAESFRHVAEYDVDKLCRAIRLVAKTAIINSLGAERARFTQAEIKDEVRFKTLGDFEFAGEATTFRVVRFVVERDPISFHHGLHYTLSWLIECGKNMSRQQLVQLLSFTDQELRMKPRCMGRKRLPRRDYTAEDFLMTVFDYPLRVCTWLAQIKAGMWVRNGISLRHQAVTYRSVSYRDSTHNRDIFLLQTAVVVCNPDRVLATIVDRYGMTRWIKGIFEQTVEDQDVTQHVDLMEDMIQLLIVLVSDRNLLIPADNEGDTQKRAVRRDLIHVLCFRPMSFSEMCLKLPERSQEHADFNRVLDEVATFKPPEGISDSGTFELKAKCAEEIDPYMAHYTKNQREEAEAVYRKWMATKTGMAAEDIVYEPKLQPIERGAFTDLAKFTRCGMFGQIMYYCLLYAFVAARFTPSVSATRVEALVNVVVHLMLIAIAEDDENASFVSMAITKQGRSNFMSDAPAAKTIVALLELMLTTEELQSCQAKMALVLRKMKTRLPQQFEQAHVRLGMPTDRIATVSPANVHNGDEERERKKKAALERQAKVMAQFQRQQKSFMENQVDVDWSDEDMDAMDQDSTPAEERRSFWKYPGGSCILCQEETDDGRLFGTFGLFSVSRILRQTDLQDHDFVREVASTPFSLDRGAQEMRPFGVAAEGVHTVEKVNEAGESVFVQKSGLSRGFPSNLARPGPVHVGCGHIMHFSCFELYLETTASRHAHQIARHHPEALDRMEFVCPLCKALGNAFLPIIWAGKEEAYPGLLHSPKIDLESFLDTHAQNYPHAHPPQRGPDPMLSVLVDYIQAKMPSLFMDGSAYGALEQTVSGGAAGANTFSSGLPAVATSDSSLASRSSSGAQASRELVKAYCRLRDTLKVNQLLPTKPPGVKETGEVNSAASPASLGWGCGALARAVAFSVSATEIQQRGAEAGYGMTLVDKIPEPTLVQLRVLSETASCYTAVLGMSGSGENWLNQEFRKDSMRQHCQLFISQYMADAAIGHGSAPHYPPLLDQDVFVFLCETVFGLAVAQDMDTYQLLRLCYLAELVKVIYHVSRNMPTAKWLEVLDSEKDGVLDNFSVFCRTITLAGMACSAEASEQRADAANAAFDQPCMRSLASFYYFLQKYALVFLRKTAILLHVHHGLNLSGYIAASHDADELSRLTTALHLPSLDDMCASLTKHGPGLGWPERTGQMVHGWIQHHVWSTTKLSVSAGPNDLPRSAAISHPAIFELVGLPHNYGDLIEECARRRCPSSGKELTDPMVCLMCGDIFCAQTYCCQMDHMVRRGGEQRVVKIGGAQQHMMFKCQRTVGLFLNVRKCSAFYLHRMSGSYSMAPYIDKYGEADIGLRHGRELFLHQRRYDSMLRSLWLGHGIPSYISRRMEADINNGGWETV